jgi:hypothetical protein
VRHEAERYQSASLTGELVGLNLDARGNATNVDPAEVLLFSVPPNAGITADGESDDYWPTVDSFVSYTAVPEPLTLPLAALALAVGFLPRRGSDYSRGSTGSLSNARTPNTHS